MKKRVAFFLGVLQVIVAIGAIPAGISMLTDPSGEGVGLTTDILAGSPFRDFQVPGLFLLIINGGFNIAGAVFSFINHRLAGHIGIALGLFLMCWIGVQVCFVGLTHFLQPLFFLIGAIEVIMGFLLTRNSRPNIPI